MTEYELEQIKSRRANCPKPVVGTPIYPDLHEFITHAWDDVDALIQALEASIDLRMQTIFSLHEAEKLNELYRSQMEATAAIKKLDIGCDCGTCQLKKVEPYKGLWERR